ncbi:hypothetical protein F5877DRAFT_83611 [Lentinula edodes]|nr:hypothetical protein F5877DRAFT_83611 [Lentinula edodes]
MSTSANRFHELFPPTLDLDPHPPVANMLVEGHRTPQYFLGWVMPLVVAAERFGTDEENFRADLLGYFNRGVLSPKWHKVTANSRVLQEHPQIMAYPTRFLRPPRTTKWLESSGRIPPDDTRTYIIIVVARNTRVEGMRLFEENSEALIQAAMESIEFPPEKRAELRWYRFV